MIKSKLSKRLIKERLNKIEEAAPSAKPFVIFIEQCEKNNKWLVTEQYEALNNKIKSKKYNITNLKQYMNANIDVPILVDYIIDDNNISLIWHILLKLANEEELDMLVNYMIEFIDTNKKNINFTRYLIELTKKYKEQFINVNLDRIYDRLNNKQLERLLKVLNKQKGGK